MLALIVFVTASLPAPEARCVRAVDPRGFIKSQLLECGMRDMDRADAALNKHYKSALRRLGAPRQVALRADERAWIARRTARCAAARQAAIPSAEINRMRCLVRETDRRTAYLAAYR